MTAKRGRPRRAEVDDAIRDAALRLIAEHGYAATSIERIAAQAGVSRPTIYRRYPNREALLVAAIAGVFGEANPVAPDGTDARDNVRTLLVRTMRMLRRAPIGGVVRAIVPELGRNPELRRLTRSLLRRRRTLMEQAIQAGIESGELPGDLNVQVVIDGLLGAVYLRLLFTGGPIHRRLAEELVDAFLPIRS